MRDILRGGLMMAILASPAATVAHDQPKTADGPEIVVTAPRLIEEEVRDFVGALTQAPANSQLSRFETRAICPAVLGMPVAMREAVVSRMRRVAISAGVPVANAKCAANVIVIVAPDKKIFIEALARRYPHYLGALTAKQVRRIAEEPGPAAAWQLAGPQLNADGVEMPFDRDSGGYVNRTTRPVSRMTAGARPQFAAAVVVVESAALNGLTTIQLADYAAMRAFARADPSRLKDSTAPTIVKVLDAPMGSAVPVTLTSWDMGFLRALYASPVNVNAPAQRSAIRRTLKKGLEIGGRQ